MKKGVLVFLLLTLFSSLVFAFQKANTSNNKKRKLNYEISLYKNKPQKIFFYIYGYFPVNEKYQILWDKITNPKFSKLIKIGVVIADKNISKINLGPIMEEVKRFFNSKHVIPVVKDNKITGFKPAFLIKLFRKKENTAKFDETTIDNGCLDPICTLQTNRYNLIGTDYPNQCLTPVPAGGLSILEALSGVKKITGTKVTLRQFISHMSNPLIADEIYNNFTKKLNELKNSFFDVSNIKSKSPYIFYPVVVENKNKKILFSYLNSTLKIPEKNKNGKVIITINSEKIPEIYYLYKFKENNGTKTPNGVLNINVQTNSKTIKSFFNQIFGEQKIQNIPIYTLKLLKMYSEKRYSNSNLTIGTITFNTKDLNKKETVYNINTFTGLLKEKNTKNNNFIDSKQKKQIKNDLVRIVKKDVNNTKKANTKATPLLTNKKIATGPSILILLVFGGIFIYIIFEIFYKDRIRERERFELQRTVEIDNIWREAKDRYDIYASRYELFKRTYGESVVPRNVLSEMDRLAQNGEYLISRYAETKSIDRKREIADSMRELTNNLSVVYQERILPVFEAIENGEMRVTPDVLNKENRIREEITENIYNRNQNQNSSNQIQNNITETHIINNVNEENSLEKTQNETSEGVIFNDTHRASKRKLSI